MIIQSIEVCLSFGDQCLDKVKKKNLKINVSKCDIVGITEQMHYICTF